MLLDRRHPLAASTLDVDVETAPANVSNEAEPSGCSRENGKLNFNLPQRWYSPTQPNPPPPPPPPPSAALAMRGRGREEIIEPTNGGNFCTRICRLSPFGMIPHRRWKRFTNENSRDSIIKICHRFRFFLFHFYSIFFFFLGPTAFYGFREKSTARVSLITQRREIFFFLNHNGKKFYFSLKKKKKKNVFQP